MHTPMHKVGGVTGAGVSGVSAATKRHGGGGTHQRKGGLVHTKRRVGRRPHTKGGWPDAVSCIGAQSKACAAFTPRMLVALQTYEAAALSRTHTHTHISVPYLLSTAAARCCCCLMLLCLVLLHPPLPSITGPMAAAAEAVDSGHPAWLCEGRSQPGCSDTQPDVPGGLE